MADVKWSNDSEFVPQGSLSDTDEIMGLTSSNINAKYAGSLLVKQNGTATLTKLTLPNSIPTQLFVSTAGSDSNNGQIIQTLLHVETAVSAASNGTQINVSPGSYSLTGTFRMKSGITLKGSGINNTFYSITGGMSIDQSQWAGSTSPKFEISDITLNSTIAADFSPITLISDSTQRYMNTTIIPDLTLSNVTNIDMDNCLLSTFNIINIHNLNMNNSTITGDVSISVSDLTADDNYTFENVDFSGHSITISNFVGSPASLTLNFINCLNINYILYNGNFGDVATINIDFYSYPTNGVQDLTGSLIVNNLTDWSKVNTKLGFGNNRLYFNNEFFWTGAAVSTPYTFVVGRGADTTSGEDNILLGRYSTSSKNGCFVWSDNTATSSDNHYPSDDNEFIIFPTGGFGICPPNNTLKAGFHYGHAYGNDGNSLISAVGAVADGNISASELNPYITTDSLFFKGKYSGGTVFNYDVSSFLTTSKPLLFQADVGPYNATSGATITGTDWVNGIITVNPSGTQTITLPSASSIVSRLQTLYGTSAVIATSTFDVVYFNQSSFTSTINAGSGITLSRGASSTVVQPLTTVWFRCFLNTTAPTFTFFGN